MSVTHFLETAEGVICQDMERKRWSKGRSQTGEGNGKGLSGHAKTATKCGHIRTGDGRGRHGDPSGHRKQSYSQVALTPWGVQMDEGTCQDIAASDLFRGTHFLDSAVKGQVRKRKECVRLVRG